MYKRIPEGLKDESELKNKRTHNLKSWYQSDGKVTANCHAGHVHYWDKFNQNGSGERFREINTILKWDDTKTYGDSNGWYCTYASYRPFIPEYADDWLDFRDVFENKDWKTKIKPVCEHVKGRVDEEDETFAWRKIIYDDAFGKGIDFQVIASNENLKKWIVIKEKPADLSQDLEFSFELDLPTGKKVKVGDNKYEVESDVDLTKLPLEIDSTKHLMIGENDEYSYLKPFKVWDSEGKIDDIKVIIEKQGNSLYFKKIISKEFLESAVYPVYTDDQSTYTSGNGDGFVSKDDSTDWDISHDAISGSTVDWTGNRIPVRVGRDLSSNFEISRVFLPFDTSGLPFGAIKISARLWLGVLDRELSDNDSVSYITVVQTFQADNTRLYDTDYDDCGDAIDDPTEGIDISERKTSISLYTGWWFFDLNSTGLGWIEIDDYTKLGLREGHDTTDHAYNGANNRYQGNSIRASDYDGGSEAPYLQINYIPPYVDYTRGDEASLPSDDTDLETAFGTDDYTMVQADDDTNYLDQDASGEFAIFQFKNQNDNNTDEITANWNGRSSTASSSATVYLQIYNQTSATWEELDNDSATAADTDFDLSGNVTSSLSDYYAVGNWASFRIYQEL